jgi:hypothetical protein
MLLLAGVPVSWVDDVHGERSTRARLVDWGEPANNGFMQRRFLRSADHLRARAV